MGTTILLLGCRILNLMKNLKIRTWEKWRKLGSLNQILVIDTNEKTDELYNWPMCVVSD